MLTSEPMTGPVLEKYRKIISRATWVRPSRHGHTMPMAVKYHRPIITMLSFVQPDDSMVMFSANIRVVRGKAWYSDGSDGPIEYEVKVQMGDNKTMDRWRKTT